MDNIGQNNNGIQNTKDTIEKDNSNIVSNSNALQNKANNFAFIYKKTEKLATALYMVTNLFADSEPMKWTLRSKVSNLVSFVIGFKNVLHFRNEEFKSETKVFILEIISLLEISAGSGLISPMNFRVLKTEFFSLIDSISTFNSEQNNAKNVELNDHFFDIKKESILNEKYSISNNQYVGSNSDKNQTSTDSRDTNDSPLLYKKTNRQNIIIGLLRKKNNLNIKDIASVIKDCSEKTIQRELVALVSLGILKKEGERRWSRYSLVNGF